MPPREDFSETVKRALAARVGNLCSNPRCRTLTSGPHEDPAKAINLGVAAHITASTPGGPRYDASLTRKQRSSAENALWLCQSCAMMIDNDAIGFRALLLQDWKVKAEEEARGRLNRTAPADEVSAGSTNYTQSLHGVIAGAVVSGPGSSGTGSVNIYAQNFYMGTLPASLSALPQVDTRQAAEHQPTILAPARSPRHVPDASRESVPHFRIERLELTNIRSFSSIVLDFAESSIPPGQLTCLAGSNGTGKTTILQSITLALLGDQLISELGRERLSSLRRRDVERAAVRAWVRNEGYLCELYIPLNAGGLDQEALNAHKDIDQMREFWRRRENQRILAAYGARRYLSSDIEDRGRHLAVDVRRQLTLFDSATQNATAKFLVRPDGAAHPILATFRILLEALFDDISIRVTEEDARFLIDGTTVAPDELSDGYRAMMPWLLDLCAAWHEKTLDVVDRSDLLSMHGIVLIDEIEMHLHPNLQIRLIGRLREVLPGIQWIVSTHSPSIISALARDEVVLLRQGSAVRVGDDDDAASGVLTIADLIRK